MADKTPAKRGSKSASIEHTTTATKAEIGKILGDSIRWMNYPEIKTEEECAARLNEFFQVCHETESYPTVEKMALALGTYRQKLWKWENGSLGRPISDMIKKAKHMIATSDADLVQAGKIPQITYIFRAKNFYDMRDQQEHVLTNGSPLGEQKTPEELAAEAAALPEFK